MGATPDHPRVPFPPPLAFLGALILALALNLLVPLPAPWPNAMPVAGIALSVVGFALAASALSRMTRAGTSPDPARPVTVLVTHGPYGVTRNPIYFGFALAYLGFTLIGRTLWGLVLTPFLILLVTRVVIAAEESYLVAHFGDEYADYSSRVRRWL